jgi:hypothetical protein
MYCPQCGATNEDSAAFCASCGTDLRKYKEQWTEPQEGDAAQTAAASDAAQTAGPPTTPPPYQPQYQQAPQTPPPYQQAPGYQQGAYYPPAGYQQPPYPPQPGYRPSYPGGVVPNIPSYLGWAIATLILCFWPTGIVAIVYATKVGNLLAVGDVYGAQEASHKAKTWCWITFGIALAAWVIAIIIIVLSIVVWGSAVIDYNY